MSKKLIKMHNPDIGVTEKKYLSETLNSGLLAGNQKNTKICEHLINNIIDSKSTFLTSSCTHALEISAIALNLKPGDEVIVPSYSFVSTALAFHMHGAKLRFCDVSHTDLNININEIEKLINNKTKAIVVLHYGGAACDIERIIDIATKYKLKVIEDNAHGLGGKSKQKSLGSFGSTSCLSFHETKNLTCGEGGAICINDEDLIETIQHIREKGTNRSSFFEGKIDKYEWIEKGSNFLPSELQSSVLRGQLERFDEIQEKREKIWNLYFDEFKHFNRNTNISFSNKNKELELTHHTFYLLFKSKDSAKSLLAFLRKENIMATSHYRPLHLSPFIKKSYSSESIDNCPVAEEIADCIVRLPLSSKMTFNDGQIVVSKVTDYLNRTLL